MLTINTKYILILMKWYLVPIICRPDLKDDLNYDTQLASYTILYIYLG